MPKAKKIDYEELHNEDLENIVAEDANTPTEPNPVEAKADEIEIPDEKLDKAVDEVKEEPKIDVEKIKADLKEEVKSEVTKEVTDAQIDKMKEAFGLEEKKDEPQTPWDKEGRTPTWTEALEYVSEQAQTKLEAKIAAEKEAAQKAEEEQRSQEESTAKQWNAYWDSQVEELTKSGKIPKMTEPKDTDPGQQARVALFKTMLDVNNDRVSKGLPQITNLKEIYYEYYKAPNQQPAGADAPIAGARKSVTSGSDDKISYEELHNSDFKDLMR